MKNPTSSGGGSGDNAIQLEEIYVEGRKPRPGKTKGRRGGRPRNSIHKANAQGKVVTDAAAPSNWRKWAHVGLDILEFIPIVGTGAAAINTGMYLQEGDYENAALSGMSLVPFGKIAATGVKGVKLLKAAGKTQKEIREASKLAKEGKAAGKNGERVKGSEKKPKQECKKCPPTPKPVYLDDGSKVTWDEEFFLPGALPLDLSRHYASDMDYRGPLGRNRIGTFDEILEALPDGRLLYRMAMGWTAAFDRPTPNIGETRAGEMHPDLALSAVSGSGYVIRERGLLKRFDRFPADVWRLVDIRDFNDNFAALTRDASGSLERVDRSDGVSFLFENDARGLRRSIALRASDGETRNLLTYAYDDTENLVVADNSYGPSIRYEYDADGRFVAYGDGAKTRIEYNYDAAGRVRAIGTPGGRCDQAFEYGPDGRSTVLSYPAAPDCARSYEFDRHGMPVAQRDPLGHRTTFERDDFGVLLADTDPEGHRTSFGYDRWGNRTSITDPEGRTTSYRYDVDGRLEAMTDSAGHQWRWGYDERGNLLWSRDPLGNRTDYLNDPAGMPIGVMRHDGLIEKRTYDASHRLVRLVDFRGHVTQFERDSFGRVLAVTDTLGHVTRYTYEERPGVDFWTASAITRPDGVSMRRSEDRSRAEITMTDGEGRRTIYRYGPFKLLEEIEDPKGGRLRFAYDHEDRLIEVLNQRGRTWTFERDAAGRVVRETDFAGLVAQYSHDSADRVVETRHPDGAWIAFTYDKAGLLLREEAWTPDAVEPVVTTYWYDARGMMAGTRNDTALVTFERDGLGRVLAETLNGRRVESVYDCCGNRTGRRIGAKLVECLYDPLGAVAEMTIGGHAPLRFERDAAGRETGRRSAAGFSLEQKWDSVGQLRVQRAGRSDPTRGSGSPDPRRQSVDVARVFDWTQDFAPRAIREALWGETAYREDEIGQVAEALRGDGTAERFGYDATLSLDASGEETGALRLWRTEPGGRVSEAFARHGERISLAYDARHRVVERRVEQDGFRPKVWRYGWDVFDRLVSCKTPSGERWAYAYDPFGRRVSKRRLLSRAERAWARTRFPHLVVASAEEREAWAVIYAPPPGADVLDAAPPVVGTAYVWDGDVVAEEASLLLDGAIDWNAATRWHYEPGLFVPVAKEAPDGALAYVVTDHLGTPRELFDEAGGLLWAMEHGVWGEPLRLWAQEAANDNAQRSGGPGGGRAFGALALKTEPEALAARGLCPIRFQGQWEDEETGLSYNRFRHYDALIGQYASPDPIGLDGGWRSHGYVLGPLVSIDPFGLNDASSSLPQIKGRSVPHIEKTLQNEGFTRTNPANPRNQKWSHPDGSEVRVHKYGNLKCCPYKSGNNAHSHKQDPSGQQLNDRGLPTSDPAESHIGIRNPKDFPTVSGRPHGS